MPFSLNEPSSKVARLTITFHSPPCLQSEPAHEGQLLLAPKSTSNETEPCSESYVPSSPPCSQILTMDFFLLLALLVSACSDSSLLFQGGPCSSRSLSFALNEPCSVEQGAVCLDSSLLLARARRINSLCEEQGRVQLLCFRRTSPHT